MNSLKFSIMPASLGCPSRVSDCGRYRIEKMDAARSRPVYVLLIATDPSTPGAGKLWDGFTYDAGTTTDHDTLNRALRAADRLAESTIGGTDE